MLKISSHLQLLPYPVDSIDKSEQLLVRAVRKSMLAASSEQWPGPGFGWLVNRLTALTCRMECSPGGNPAHLVSPGPLFFISPLILEYDKHWMMGENSFFSLDLMCKEWPSILIYIRLQLAAYSLSQQWCWVVWPRPVFCMWSNHFLLSMEDAGSFSGGRISVCSPPLTVGEWAKSPSLQWETVLQLDSHEVISGELGPEWK